MLGFFKKLSDSVVRKFVEVVDVTNWEIQSDTGWTEITSVNKTVKYDVYKVTFESGRIIKCADNHIFIDVNYDEVFAINSVGRELLTVDGSDRVISVVSLGYDTHMYDFSLAEESNHLYYGNGVLSHNSTLMTIVAVWTALFFPDQTVMIIANKQSTATEIFERIRLAFLQMDNWLKGGVKEFNKTFFTLANNSRILTSATSADAIRGYSIDVLLLDEFGIIPPKDAEDFWAAVTPTLSTRFNNNPNAKLIVSSTPKGTIGKFYDLVSKAEAGLNDFALQRAYWYDVPGRTEQFKKDEIATLGEDLFKQEYECEFLSSSNSPFSSEMFFKFENEMIEPLNILEDGNYIIWREPKPNRIYMMGVDTSEGVGQDYSVAQILDVTDPLDIEQVARYATNTMDTTTWSLKLKEIAAHWGNPILLIERNGPGGVPCDKFFYDWNYPRMINHTASTFGKTFVKPGLLTNNNTKIPCITNMKYYISDRRSVKIYDKETIAELKTFVRSQTPAGNVKWAAQLGFHDDFVIALAWALYGVSRYVADTWLNIIEVGSDGLPRKIEPKWTLEFNTDIQNSLYKKMSNTSPFIGVFVMTKPNASFSNAGIVQSIANNRNNTAKPGTLEYLLDNAQMSLYEGITPQLPASFNRYF